MGFTGIALSTTLAGWVNAALLGWRLHRDGAFALDARAADRLPKIVFSALAMGLGLALLASALSGAFYGGIVQKALALGALVALGGGVFGALCIATGAARLDDLRSALRRQPSTPGNAPEGAGS
jgi:putative peptidoglycan lipid II flippase